MNFISSIFLLLLLHMISILVYLLK